MVLAIIVLSLALGVSMVALAMQWRRGVDGRRRHEALKREQEALRQDYEEVWQERESLLQERRKLVLESEALQVSEAKYSNVFRNSPDAVAIATFPEGRILEVNEGFVQLVGWTAEMAVGKTATDLGLWRRPQDRQQMLGFLTEMGEVTNLKVELTTREGERRTCMLSAELIELAGLRRLLSVTRDISDLEEAEREREVLLHQLRAKNAELEGFTYTVSHDLKSPLFTIGGFLEMLLSDARSGKIERMELDADRIRMAIKHMEELLEGLLELSRAGQLVGELEDVDLTALAKEAEKQLAREIQERGVEVRIESEMLPVHGDRLRVFQVLQNLLGNAIKFLGDQENPRIEIGTKLHGEDMVLCRIVDNGVGIAPEDLEKVFGLFARVGNVKEVSGTGVGLALVQKIIQAHGGQICVESDGLGHGAEFFFTLPIGKGIQEAAEAGG